MDQQSCTIDISENPFETGASLLSPQVMHRKYEENVAMKNRQISYHRLRSIQIYIRHSLYREYLVPRHLTGYESSIIILYHHNSLSQWDKQSPLPNRLSINVSITSYRLSEVDYYTAAHRWKRSPLNIEKYFRNLIK